MNWLLLGNSLFVGALACGLAVAFGVVVALAAAGAPSRLKPLLNLAAIISLALPPFLVANSWLGLLGPGGAWTHWLSANVVSLGGGIWILALLLWPIAFFALQAGWAQLEAQHLEIEPGLAGLKLVRYLLLPAARNHLAQSSAIIFVLALNNFAVPAILQIKVLPMEAWVRFNTEFDVPGTWALSWPLCLGPLAVLIWLTRRPISWTRSRLQIPPRMFRQQLTMPFYFGSVLLAAGICLLSAGVPVISLLAEKRTWTELSGAVLAGKAALQHSLITTFFPASLLVIAGVLIRVPRFIQYLAWALLLMPGILLGIGLIYTFNHDWSGVIYQSSLILIVALVLRYLALGLWSGQAALNGIDRDILEAGRLDGAGRWQLFRFVQWPLISRQIGFAWYLLFLLCLWDVETLVLIIPPGGETLSLRIFNLLHYGHNAQVSALCLVLLVLAAMPLALAGLWRWGSRRWVSAGGALVLVGAFTSGCGSHSLTPSHELHSAFFDRVEVIGSRGTGVGQLNKPRSVAVDRQDNLYVVDMTGRVQKFSPDGKFILQWQMPQTDLGKPKGMGRDQDGNIIVLEPHYQRVNIYSPGGGLVRQWGVKGTNVGQMNLPRAIVADAQNQLYVSEYGLVERVQLFSADGSRCLRVFGHPGNGPGEFNRAEGLCLDKAGRLYVADSCNHRIQIFDAQGNFLRAYGKPGSGPGELSYPYDICVDQAGCQYVCEFGNSRIQIFDAADHSLEIIGGPGNAPGKFSNPWGVALDSKGNLYVADSQNHRVQKLLRNTGALAQVLSR